MIKKLFLIIFLLSLNKFCFGATEFVCTINKTGEDYNTLTLWEDALDNAGNITAADCKVFSLSSVATNFADGEAVTGGSSGATGTCIHQTVAQTQILIDAISGVFQSGETITGGVAGSAVLGNAGDSAIIVASCYDDDGEMTGNVTVDGFRTGASNYIKITAPVGERHDGKRYGTGARMTTTTQYNHTVYLNDDYSIVEWMGLSRTAAASGSVAIFRIDAGNCTVQNNIVTGINSAWAAIRNNATTGNIFNNVVYNWPASAGIQANSTSNPALLIYNNTVYNSVVGVLFTDTANLSTVKNNLCIGNTTADYSVGNATVATNGSGDLTGQITGLTTAEWVSVGAGTEDFHLATGATSINAGTDLGTGSFSFDIDNRDRDAEGDVWDIGADEYISAAPAVLPLVIINNL